MQPAEPVTDFRTAVTGRTAADLEAVDYSLEDAQRDVLSALQGGLSLHKASAKTTQMWQLFAISNLSS